MRRAALAVLAASLPVLAPSAAHAFHVTEIDRWSSPLDLPPDLLGAGLTLAASPDGANVYAASAAAGTILVFERGPVSGTLALNEIEQDGVGSADGIEGVRDVIVSRDGANVYAAGYGEDAVAVFARDAGSGALALVEVERDGVGGVAGLVAPRDIALSPGGEHLYAVGSAAIAVFARGADGRLAFVEFQSEAADAIDGLTDAEVVLVSADGRHVYVGARGEAARSRSSRATRRRARSPGSASSRTATRDPTSSTRSCSSSGPPTGASSMAAAGRASTPSRGTRRPASSPTRARPCSGRAPARSRSRATIRGSSPPEPRSVRSWWRSPSRSLAIRRPAR